MSEFPRLSSFVHIHRAESHIIFVPPVPCTQEYLGYYIVPSNYYGGAAHANTSKEIETNNEIDGHRYASINASV